MVTTSAKPIVVAVKQRSILSHCKQHFLGSQVRVHFSVTMQIFDLHLTKKYKTNKIQIKKEGIKELTNLYIPEMAGLRNLYIYIYKKNLYHRFYMKEKIDLFRIQSSI